MLSHTEQKWRVEGEMGMESDSLFRPLSSLSRPPGLSGAEWRRARPPVRRRRGVPSNPQAADAPSAVGFPPQITGSF